jgi:hypothetical protein
MRAARAVPALPEAPRPPEPRNSMSVEDERTGVATPEGGLRTSSLRASFAHPDPMQTAIDALEINGFDRADISVLKGGDPTAAIPEGGDTAAPYNDEDARQARTLQASGAASVAALAAAGVTIATGGLAAIAIGAAVAAGAAAGGVTHVLSTAANSAEQDGREATAAQGLLTLSVQVPTPEKQAKAEEILRAAGATSIAVV